MAAEFKPYLPGLLDLIADEIAVGVAVSLAKEFGGREIYIPKSVKEGGELSKLLGHENAQKLAKLLGSGQLKVPAGNFGGEAGRRQQIAMRLDQGLTQDQVAKDLDVSLRTVERVARKMRGGKKGASQLDLFSRN